MGSMGIDTKILSWTRNWLMSRMQRVVIRGENSSWKPVLSGVSQGSVIVPLLFLIYINDIDEGLKNQIVKFADDTKLYQAISSPEDQRQLQGDINKIQSWSEKWQMQFNVTKCKRLHIGNKNSRHKYSMSDQELKNSTRERDLGIQIQEDLDWEAHVGKTVAQANKILGMIW